ncbi:helix-turn-helix domain-containing protein [Seonamhaeicola sp. S2-3]|uniref:helix-turn-helix domain-containing protein n=1 Tax=Seonamhaeicola sp. S2-3 TaxID=1936081 RepID=UPI0009FA74B6
MEAAKQALERGRGSVTEVMFDCGYRDPKAFRDVFKNIVGISPMEYKRKYERIAIG